MRQQELTWGPACCIIESHSRTGAVANRPLCRVIPEQRLKARSKGRRRGYLQQTSACPDHFDPVCHQGRSDLQP